MGNASAVDITMAYESWCNQCAAVTEHLDGHCLKCQPMTAQRGAVPHPVEEQGR
jgi:hypothetical protein